MPRIEALNSAVERAVGAKGDAPILLTCEHASNEAPPGFSWALDDQWLRETHWAYDIGAADLTRELARDLEAAAVLSRFTRLLVDPNRNLQSETLFREVAEGRSVSMNDGLGYGEKQRRIDELYTPYHDEVRRQLTSRSVTLLLSIHSYTPEYEGQARAVELGVLHCGNLDLARHWRSILARTGFDVRVDEPYAGSDGLMFSAQHHAEEHGLKAIELEVRQDLAANPVVRRQIGDLIRLALLETGVISR